MKKLLCLLLCLLCLSAFALAEPDHESLPLDKLDLSSLNSEELEQFILTAVLELCSREDFVNDLNTAPLQNRFKSLFGNSGIHLIFCDTKESWFYIPLSSEQVELMFKTRLEQIIEEAAQIELP